MVSKECDDEKISITFGNSFRINIFNYIIGAVAQETGLALIHDRKMSRIKTKLEKKCLAQ